MKISYVIGYRNEEGSISAYMIHSNDIFHGTIEQAKLTLEYVKSISKDEKKDEKYGIFKLV